MQNQTSIFSEAVKLRGLHRDRIIDSGEFQRRRQHLMNMACQEEKQAIYDQLFTHNPREFFPNFSEFAYRRQHYG